MIRPVLEGPLPADLAALTGESLASELGREKSVIDAAYWRFSRTSSPKVAPPEERIFMRSRWIREAMRRLHTETLAHAAPAGECGT